ncbi:MAG: TetR/AcrR family transcriptional regulator [Alphaproteobacteria bacterium]|nr:TetR/AcrR family transcriptional regulator [Alphaproteobacteria bacterium]
MAQVKKDEIRDRILASAESLFAEHGYVDTTMASIAKLADVSKSNIYVYFGSKLEILWAISDPWLRERFDALESEIAELPDSQSRIERLFEALWIDLPAERNGFANNMMQALSTTDDSDGYSRDLLAYCETRISTLLSRSLPAVPLDVQAISHIALMAFDGFAIGQRLSGGPDIARNSVRAFANLLHSDVQSMH